MDKTRILKLVKRADVIPKLEYDDDILKFRDNICSTLIAVRKRLEALEELRGEVEFELTLNHLDDEEY